MEFALTPHEGDTHELGRHHSAAVDIGYLLVLFATKGTPVREKFWCCNCEHVVMLTREGRCELCQSDAVCNPTSTVSSRDMDWLKREIESATEAKT